MKKKIVFIVPHLSTGGMPQYLVKQIELIKDDCEVYCVEWGNVTGGVLVVQRNKVVNLLGDRLITLGEDKYELFNVINKIQPDVIHLQEIPELFMENGIAEKLYDPTRNYILIETSHDSGYDTNNKIYLPDKFLMVSQYQVNNYKRFDIPCDVVEYPIENKARTKTREQALRDLGLDPNLRHIINVGLFTPRKNQAEVIEYARMLQNYPIQFHFIGNQADNFKFYWEPLMKDFPPNCKWWNERSDVDSFYEAADLFLFTSRGHATDMETMPLVIRESLGWKVPSLIYNLPVYMGYFDKYDTIEYLTEDLQKNAYRIAEKLLVNSASSHEHIFHTLNGEENLSSINYYNDTTENIKAYGDAAGQYFANFYLKELERGDFKINSGDVFVDLGANIGMSSFYAKSQGAVEIHCFEPDPNMRELIQKNVPSAKIYPYAITNTETELELYHWPFNPEYDGPKYKCKGISLKQVLKLVNKKIDYLKIDIEGFETSVFDTVTVEECSIIKKMMIEYHSDSGVESFCDLLRSKGFDIVYIERGYQSFIYALNNKFRMKENYKFTSRWGLQEQQIYYSVNKPINFPVSISLKEYKSDAVMWSLVMPSMLPNIEYWMRPVNKDIHSYEDDSQFTGVKLCIYDKETGEQLYEHPYVHQFVNLPRVTLSNSVPYYNNYMEYFVEQKYGKWLNHPYKTVVDAGANVGVFSSYMLFNNYATKIIAIECDKKALTDLQNNFKHNTTVTVLPKALSSTSDEVTFYHSPDNPVISSTLSPDTLTNHNAGLKGNVTYSVPAITLQTLLDEYKEIDLLKVDIEGGEYKIFMNAEEKLFDYINNIIIECHFFESDYKEKYTMLKNKLTKLGYSIEEYVENQVEVMNPGSSECIFATKNNL